MKRFIVLVIGAATCACGGSDNRLSDRFRGDWNGTLAVSIFTLDPFEYAARLPINVSGSTATAGGVCPDGSGSLSFNVADSSASWQGQLLCPAVRIGSCTAVTVVYQSATMSLKPSNTLTAEGTGMSITCDGLASTTMKFVGTK